MTDEAFHKFCKTCENRWLIGASQWCILADLGNPGSDMDASRLGFQRKNSQFEANAKFKRPTNCLFDLEILVFES